MRLYQSKLRMHLSNGLNYTLILFVVNFVEAVAQSNDTDKIPSVRYMHQMVYDEGNHQILMFGGTGNQGTCHDLWALNSAGWRKLSDTGPEGRIKAALAYDINRKQVVLFGGSGSSNQLLNDTWEWDGRKWNQNSSNGPSARNHALAVYDQARKVTLLFGGVGPSGLLTDTWAFDGTAWKQVNADGPKNCLPHGLIYDEEQNKTILITLSVIRDPADEAHALNDLWEWTGQFWKKLPETNSITTSSNLQALTNLGKSGILLFDGSDVSENQAKTWVYAQGHWTYVSGAGPVPRVGHSIVYDESRNVAVLFGGGAGKSFLNDLWQWDGKVWKEIK